MKQMLTVFSLALVLLLGVSPLAQAQTTWYVDCKEATSGDGTSFASPFNTIQEGLDAAFEGMFTVRIGGDTVLVEDGTCYENLVWPDEIPGLVGANFLTLASVDGAETTIIDGSTATEDLPVISFAALVGGMGNVVDGFTLTNPTGATTNVINVLEGVVCDITVQNSIISNGYNGIGMFSVPALGRITADNSTFLNNSSYGIEMMGLLQILFYTPTFAWITDCTFENNGEGAIWLMAGNAEITGNEVRNNTGTIAATIMAGTINMFDVLDPTTILISDNVIENNSGSGIGTFVPEPCTITISGNTVSGNYGTGTPAVSVGIAALGPASLESSFDRPAAGHVVISHNTVSNLNDPTGLTMGIAVQGCRATITGNTVHGIEGGGPFPAFGHPADTLVSSGIAVQGWSAVDPVQDFPGIATITNNIIYGNSTGVFADYTVAGSAVTLANNTIVENNVGVQDYAVAEQSTISNCIIWDNVDDLLNTAATFSDIGDGDAGTGNIAVDPELLGAGDYHLQASSPCIDTGWNDAPGIPYNDIDDQARIMDGDANLTYIVDMGADEVPGAVLPTGWGPASTIAADKEFKPVSILFLIIPVGFVVLWKGLRRRK